MDLRMTPRRSEGRSDEAPLRRGGGKNSAPFALLQQPALNWFQGRLLLPGKVATLRTCLFLQWFLKTKNVGG